MSRRTGSGYGEGQTDNWEHRSKPVGDLRAVGSQDLGARTGLCAFSPGNFQRREVGCVGLLCLFCASAILGLKCQPLSAWQKPLQDWCQTDGWRLDKWQGVAAGCCGKPRVLKSQSRRFNPFWHELKSWIRRIKTQQFVDIPYVRGRRLCFWGTLDFMHFAGWLGQHSFGLALRCLSPGESVAPSDAWTVIT